MTEKQIREIAEEYAGLQYDGFQKVFREAVAKDTERFLRWFSERYYPVEKERAAYKYNEAKRREDYWEDEECLDDNDWFDYGFWQGERCMFEALFDKSKFNQNIQKYD
ncbi:MAG: hypothetical protein NC311_14910 [Muribaculaceae bacterium]|nr:hypothetical protein [Muribaculaceae bacterium]